MTAANVQPSKRACAALLLGPVVFIAGLAVLRLVSYPAYIWSIREDGIVEYLTSLAYLLAAVLALIAALRFRRAGNRLCFPLFLLASVGFFFVCGEEISWGQRLFGFESPEFFLEKNLQEETTIHNLVGGEYVHAAYVALCAYCIISPLLLGLWRRRAPPATLRHLVPDRCLIMFFVPRLVYFLLPMDLILYGEVINWKEQEPVEMLIALGLTTFLALDLRQLTREQA